MIWQALRKKHLHYAKAGKSCYTYQLSRCFLKCLGKATFLRFIAIKIQPIQNAT
ncbi:hypothetical protein EV680_12627 [Uruburuella suis]|uniref:Uncharacterized protein n=1 Tax=Uruburuella suis TaxID=252130 RepID=A0ABY2BX10_9NEIS|nr:hypothetical protein EV680_12627 [Uruburuella suis]